MSTEISLYIASGPSVDEAADLLVTGMGFEPESGFKEGWRNVRSEFTSVVVKPEKDNAFRENLFGFPPRLSVTFYRHRNLDPECYGAHAHGSVDLILRTYTVDVFYITDNMVPMLARNGGVLHLFNRAYCWSTDKGVDLYSRYITVPFTWSNAHHVELPDDED